MAGVGALRVMAMAAGGFGLALGPAARPDDGVGAIAPLGGSVASAAVIGEAPSRVGLARTGGRVHGAGRPTHVGVDCAESAAGHADGAARGAPILRGLHSAFGGVAAVGMRMPAQLGLRDARLAHHVGSAARALRPARRARRARTAGSGVVRQGTLLRALRRAAVRGAHRGQNGRVRVMGQVIGRLRRARGGRSLTVGN